MNKFWRRLACILTGGHGYFQFYDEEGNWSLVCRKCDNVEKVVISAELYNNVDEPEVRELARQLIPELFIPGFGTMSPLFSRKVPSIPEFLASINFAAKKN